MGKKRKNIYSPLVKLIEENKKSKPLLYNTTKEDCEKWFNILNKIFFDGDLPPIDVYDIRWRRGVHARYNVMETYQEEEFTQIDMNKRYESKMFFVEVLAHEIIHHYQYIYDYNVCHGNVFQKLKEKYGKKGLNIP